VKKTNFVSNHFAFDTATFRPLHLQMLTFRLLATFERFQGRVGGASGLRENSSNQARKSETECISSVQCTKLRIHIIVHHARNKGMGCGRKGEEKGKGKANHGSCDGFLATCSLAHWK
jgi:hypothetical protein